MNTINIQGKNVKVPAKKLKQAKAATSSLEYNLIDLAYDLADIANKDITDQDAIDLTIILRSL